MKKKPILLLPLLIVVAVVVLAGAFFWQERGPALSPIALEALAKCLSDQGALMYGTYWCPVCQSQKEMFGDAAQFLPYVECTERPQECVDAGVRGFPTWIFRDGTELIGLQEAEDLARASGCALGTAEQMRIN